MRPIVKRLIVKVATRKVKKTMKKWYKSKTIWLNAAVLALVVLDQVTVSGVLAAYPVAIPMVAAANLLLRAYTDKAVTV